MMLLPLDSMFSKVQDSVSLHVAGRFQIFMDKCEWNFDDLTVGC